MKVLFATDGSACSRHAIQEGLRLLGPQALEATVVAVADVAPLTYGFDGMAPTATVVLDALEPTVKADLTEAAALLAEAGVKAETIERQGHAATEILAVAHALRPDLIVLGSHGRGAVARLLLGGVSTEVVHHWPGATLVIRPQA
jgi:nucleotide-binding universal stress UspA family protein